MIRSTNKPVAVAPAVPGTGEEFAVRRANKLAPMLVRATSRKIVEERWLSSALLLPTWYVWT
ncbi:hypothetical protein [Streptomyces collinus]|uniref:hypothetical protein n=1 Tax=Streptomyces collinus TaxID=42684 RepID=UPI0037FEAA71